jgi:hypothetical protein
MLSGIILEYWDYVNDYRFSRYYMHIPETTDRDRLKKLALISQNELSYHMHKKRIKYSDLDSSTVINILSRDTAIFKNDRTRFDIAMTLHHSRNKTRQSIRYQNWKEHSSASLTGFEFCACCGSKTSLVLDHCLEHDSFRLERLAYDVLNSEWLCCTCNEHKPSNHDYRTPEMKAAQQKYVASHLSGQAIIPA